MTGVLPEIRSAGDSGSPLAVTVRAPAKVNLYLEILGRRPDGYHELVSLMQKVPLYDVLTACPAEGGVTLSCPGSALPEGRENLVYQAAERFFARHCPDASGVSLTLEKRIPVAAGLGGGSSDAAATLLALRALFSPALPDAPLRELARGLGADVSFFLAPWPAAWATGRGDDLLPALPVCDHDMILLNPGFAVSTRWVYESFSLTHQWSSNKINNFLDLAHKAENPFAQRTIRLEELRNDLERITGEEYREVGLMLQALRDEGAKAVLMSGSGPTVFGLFSPGSVDDRCRERLAARFSTVIVLPAALC